MIINLKMLQTKETQQKKRNLKMKVFKNYYDQDSYFKDKPAKETTAKNSKNINISDDIFSNININKELTKDQPDDLLFGGFLNDDISSINNTTQDKSKNTMQQNVFKDPFKGVAKQDNTKTVLKQDLAKREGNLGPIKDNKDIASKVNIDKSSKDNKNTLSKDSKNTSSKDNLNNKMSNKSNPVVQSKNKEVLKDEMQSYSSRAHYDRDKKSKELEEHSINHNAEMQDFSAKADECKTELSYAIENSIKSREVALESIQSLGSTQSQERSPFKTSRSSKINESYRRSIDSSYYKANDLSMNELFAISKHNKEAEMNLLSSDNEVYKGNLALLDDIKTVVCDLIQKDDSANLLKNMVDLLNERVLFDKKDLEHNLDKVLDNVDTVNQGTKKLDKMADKINGKVDGIGYTAPLARIQDKINKLKDANKENSQDAEECKHDLENHKDRLMNKDPKLLTPEELPELRNELIKIEGDIETSEEISKDNLDKYFQLLKELEDLKSEIEKENEKLIRELQRKDDDLINKTDKNLNETKDILGELKPKIKGNSPFLKKYNDKLAEIEKLLDKCDKNNKDNKAKMKELSNKKLEDDDYFDFITDLAKEQKQLDVKVEENKENSDNLLKKIKDLKSLFDDEEKNLKDQIAFDCQKMLNSKLNSLADLEEKLRKLEIGIESSLKTSNSSLLIIGKSEKEWNDISKINKEYVSIEKNTKKLRLSKDELTLNIQRLNQTLQNYDLKQMSIEKLIDFQNSTKTVYQSYDVISMEIDSEIDTLKDVDTRFQNLLITIRDIIKQKGDKLTEEMKQRLSVITKFLKPIGSVSDSIQRPQKLNQLLIESQFNKEDPDFVQYKKYCDLINDNLSRCNYATNDLKKLDDNLMLLLDEYSMLQSNNAAVINQIEIYKRLYDKIKNYEGPSIDLHNTIQSILADVNAKKEQEIIDFLNRIKQKRQKEAQNLHDKLGDNLGSLERKWREANNENEEFIDMLKDNHTNNKDKQKLIDQLMKESEDSRKDLIKIKQDADEAKKILFSQDPVKANIDELYIQTKILDKYNNLIDKRLDDVKDIYNEIIERKKRWHDFLNKSEIKDKLIADFQLQLAQLNEKYNKMKSQTNYYDDLLTGFLLVIQKIQENQYYETDKAPCANKDNLKLQISDYKSKVDKYGPRVKKLSCYDAVKLKTLDCEEIEQLSSEANNMLKLLDTDNTNLGSIIAYLDNERIEFKDGDIYANRDRVSKQLKTANNLLEALRTELNSIKIKLESTEISNQNIIKNFKKDQNNLKSLEETIEMNSKLFIEVSKEIDKESMNKAKLSVIAPIIEKLGQIIYNISSLQSKVDEIKDIINDIFSDLNAENYFKKLKEANIENKELLDKLAKLGNLIDKLIEVSKIFKDYTSDDDEKKFVNTLGTELLDLK